MPIYTIQGPDGRIYDVEMPTGAASEGQNAPTVGGSPAQPIPAAPEAANTPSQPFQRAGVQPQAPFEALQPAWDALGSGVSDAGVKGYLGIKQLFGGLGKDEKGVLEQQRLEKSQDPMPGTRTIGDIGANIALSAIPATKAATVLNGTRAITALGRAAPAATGALTSGAQEFLLANGKGDTYAEQMGSKAKEAAKAAAIGGALIGTLSALARPFKATKSAEDLMAQKVYPTLSQGAEGKVAKGVGGLTSGVLPTARRQNQEVVTETMRQILPNTAEAGLPKTTGDIARAMDNVGSEYAPLFQGKKFPMSSKDKGKIWAAALRAAGKQPDVKEEVLSRLGNSGNALRSGNTVTLSADSMRAERAYIQDQINRVSGDPSTKAKEVKRGLIAAKESFDEIVRNRKMSPEELAQLTDLDHRYADARRVLEGTQSVEARKQLKVADILRGFQKMDPKGGTGFATADSQLQRRLLDPATEVMNINPNQDQMRSLLVASGRAGLKAATGAGALAYAPWLAPFYATSLVGQTKQGSRALFGDYEAQKALAELLRRKGGGLALGAALNNQDSQE